MDINLIAALGGGAHAGLEEWDTQQAAAERQRQFNTDNARKLEQMVAMQDLAQKKLEVEQLIQKAHDDSKEKIAGGAEAGKSSRFDQGQALTKQLSFMKNDTTLNGQNLGRQNVLDQIAAANGRWATPSGNAQLGAAVTQRDQDVRTAAGDSTGAMFGQAPTPLPPRVNGASFMPRGASSTPFGITPRALPSTDAQGAAQTSPPTPAPAPGPIASGGAGAPQGASQLDAVTPPSQRPNVLQRVGSQPAAAAPQPSSPAPSIAAPPAPPPTSIDDAGAARFNEAALKNVDPGVANQVRAIAEGRQAPPAQNRTNQFNRGVMRLVSLYDPSFDAVNYTARAKTRAAFTSGTEAKSVNALNTAIEHLDELSQVSDALKNRSVPVYNSVANTLESAFGAPAVNNFKTVVNRVVPELVQAYRGTGGAEADIQTNTKNFDSSASPEQLHGALQETAKLLESKIRKLQDQYNAGMGTAAVSVVSPKAQEVLHRLAGKQAAVGAGGTSGGFSVQTNDGVTHTFPTQAALNGFAAAAKKHGLLN